MNLIKDIAESQLWDDHKESLFFIFIFVLFPSFLPVWITLFAMFLTGNWSNIGELIQHGAFFIYSAALLSSAVEKLDGTYQKPFVNGKRFLYHFSWMLIVFSTVGFMVAIIPDIFIPYEIQKTNTVTWTSFGFVLVSLGILYYAHYRSKLIPNPEQESHMQVNEIMGKLS